KRLIVRDLAKRNRFGRRLIGELIEQKPARLAEVLIGGILSEKEESGELPKFDLNPVPNYFFMRDPQVVLGDRVVISSMATQARRRESLLSRYIFLFHPLFREQEDIFLVDFMRDAPERPIRRSMATLEGGDVLVPRRDLLLVGLSERTNRAGIEELAASLTASKAGV